MCPHRKSFRDPIWFAMRPICWRALKTWQTLGWVVFNWMSTFSSSKWFSTGWKFNDCCQYLCDFIFFCQIFITRIQKNYTISSFGFTCWSLFWLQIHFNCIWLKFMSHVSALIILDFPNVIIISIKFIIIH